MCQLTGQSALITGGIGFGIALELARAGGRVAIAGLNLQRATAAAEEIRAMDREAIALHLDVIDAQSVARCVQECADQFSSIDILINNAGIHCESIGQPSQVEHFSRCFDVNLFGAWRMSQAVVPHSQCARARRHRQHRLDQWPQAVGRYPGVLCLQGGADQSDAVAGHPARQGTSTSMPCVLAA